MWKAHLAAVTWLLYAQLSYSSASAADSSHGSPVCTVPGSVVHTLSLAGIGSAGHSELCPVTVYWPWKQLQWQQQSVFIIESLL